MIFLTLRLLVRIGEPLVWWYLNSLEGNQGSNDSFLGQHIQGC